MLWTGEEDVCKLRKENKKMKKDLGKLKQELSGLDHVSASLVVIIPPTNEIRGLYWSQQIVGQAIGLFVKCCISVFSQFSSHLNELLRSL